MLEASPRFTMLKSLLNDAILIGMKYLHYGAPMAIVHGDLKSLNGM